MKNRHSKPLGYFTFAVLSASIGQAHAETLKVAALNIDKVEVAAKRISDTKPVKGYQAKRSLTATKTDRPLIDVPQSVSVVTQEQMSDQSVQSMSDAVRYVPGVTASQGEGNRDALNFRGSGVTTGDFYLDGIRDDVQTYRDFYNTDRVEVLKGPNGMAFGRGASGGAINRVSKEAGWDPVREIKATYGAYNQKRTSIDIGNGINDVAAFRLNAVYEESDSYRSGVNLKRYGVNPTFTITPTENTKITFGAEYFKDQHIGDRGIPSIGSELNNRPYRLEDYKTFYGNASLSPNETETKALNAMIEHAFNDNLSIRNRTRYASYDKFYQNVYADGAVANNLFAVGAYRDTTDRKNFINQTDIIYKINTGRFEHQLLAGMEVGTQKTTNARFIAGNSERISSSVSALSPTYTLPISLSNTSRNQASEIDIFALYVQDQIKISEQWEAIVGVRHDQLKTNYDNIKTSQTFDVTDSLVSPRAGLIFKPLENLSVYGSYSLSYVPRAGDQLISLTATTKSLQPEKFINKELGAKYDITPQLSLTAAIYELERKNVAITDPANTAQNTIIDGQLTKGAEFGIAGKITDRWSMVGGYSYQDATFTKAMTISGLSYIAGATLGQTPSHTFSLWNRYDFNETWGAAIGVVSRSQMYALTPSTTASTILPGFARVDAALFWKATDKMQLQLNVENLTNKDYVASAHTNNNLTPGAPLTARATLTYHF
ncbi:TonB-dependent receptor [Candidatus Methylopumilus turicensis]|uniref:TonB-dependent siderophore receptor n=1 Tax=Candidatus Methylopumilus turicensis TaxID=1581680 RepID=A0A0B7IY64_9PROT|nr:TonB-dependent siderophore receptor [Candidatus Methylopumilus turicensis]CEN55366.1 TonB-dependent siderophore receptor [Candidatus Methylopumilus turicensis]